MEPLMTEAVGRITYGPHEPTSFMLSDDLLDRCRTRLNTYNALDPATILGAQGTLF